MVSKGKYIPTATSIGLRTCIMIMAMPMKTPTTTRGQGMSPPTTPTASVAISPACGAESSRLPKAERFIQQRERENT